ncbi:PDZ domain-containing protein [bacterium]|nr:PDZ domain-containing protein [bacterium]
MKKSRLTLATVLFLATALLIGATGSGYFEISKNLDIFITLYKKVDELYVDELDHSRIMRKGIDAMLAELDPYTVYYSESEVEDFNFQRTGTYAGIGTRIMKFGDDLVVTEVYEDAPALEAGLQIGDILLAIDGKSVLGKSVSDMSEILKGEENTVANLRIKRNGAEMDLPIKRAEVKIDNVSYFGMVTEDIGYVKFENFRMDAALEVKEKMEELKDRGMKKFILDMRGNPGGLLKEAVDIVNLFVDANHLVVSTKGKNPDHSRDYNTYKKVYDDEIPLVVLIDGGSASASEIVSGSIQDYDRGVVIGRNSYGKGLVQITQPLSYNAQLKVTTSKYYTASGRCIQRLDYALRDEDGNVPEVPDSLIKEFKTKNGRPVFDGEGISPDLEVAKTSTTPYTRALTNEHLVFYFAHNYLKNHSEIASPNKFVVDDNLLNEFKQYVQTQSFNYKTKTEKKLDHLMENLEAGADSMQVLAKFNELTAFLNELKANDFTNDSEKIREMLRLEIVAQRYFRKGRAQAALTNDNDVARAVEVLNNPTEYHRILMPQ